MAFTTARAPKIGILCTVVAGLSACATPDYEVPDQATDIAGPRQVETLGETIAREQQGEDGCLVAGNLNKGGECAKLREIMLPPAPPSDPKL